MGVDQAYGEMTKEWKLSVNVMMSQKRNQTRTHFCIKSMLLQYASKPKNHIVSKRRNGTSRGKEKKTHELQVG